MLLHILGLFCRTELYNEKDGRTGHGASKGERKGVKIKKKRRRACIVENGAGGVKQKLSFSAVFPYYYIISMKKRKQSKPKMARIQIGNSSLIGFSMGQKKTRVKKQKSQEFSAQGGIKWNVLDFIQSGVNIGQSVGAKSNTRKK